MNSTSFDALTRSFALSSSRRQVLKFFTTGLAGGLFLRSKNATGGPAVPQSSAALQERGVSSLSSLTTTSLGGGGGFPAAQSEPLRTFEVLSYRATEYRFKVIPLHDRPPRGFARAGFDADAANFGTGNAAFGSKGTLCSLQGTVSTLWPLESQLVLRRFISIPPGTIL